MRIFKNTIVILTVLGLLVGTYYIITNLSKEDEYETGEPANIYTFNEESLVKIKVQSQDSELIFIKDADNWQADVQPDIELNQDKVNELCNNFTSINAKMRLDNPLKDLGEYGLNSPQAVLNIELADGKTRTFYLGGTTFDESGYYFKDEKTTDIYVVSTFVASNILVTLSDLRDKVLFPIKPEDIDYIKITLNEDNIIELGTKEYEKDNIAKTFSFGEWRVFQPHRGDGDYEAIALLVDRITNTQINEFISDDETVDLEQYGLVDNASQLFFKTKDGEEYHLLIGEYKDENQIYIKEMDSVSVYTVRGQSVDFSDLSPFGFIAKFAFIVDINLVQKITIESETDFYNIALKRIKSNDGNDEEVFEINNKIVDNQIFKNFYQSLIGLWADGVNDRGHNKSKPDIKTVFYLKDPDTGLAHKVTLEYIPQDRYFYTIVKNGKADFIISRDKIDRMLKQLESLAE